MLVIQEESAFLFVAKKGLGQLFLARKSGAKANSDRLTNEIKTTPVDHQPICFPSSCFLVLGISLSEVKDTIDVLNAQKSISKITICRTNEAENDILRHKKINKILKTILKNGLT
ncbi:hypothetical protein NC651_033648 [Populus alba x Populus x berolinensis]|nr:hypothetical protein NC651_033648 [Populus alba x Populus x berolinensis]